MMPANLDPQSVTVLLCSGRTPRGPQPASGGSPAWQPLNVLIATEQALAFRV